MSSGANIGDGRPEGIGDDPTDLSAWELLNLGWLGAQEGKGPFYQVVQYGEKANIKLGPNVPGTKSPQAAFVVLPDKLVDRNLGPGAEAGDYFWAKGKQDFTSTMTAPAAAGALAAKVRYDIEDGWDYAFVQAQVGGAWVAVKTNLSTTTDPQVRLQQRPGRVRRRLRRRLRDRRRRRDRGLGVDPRRLPDSGQRRGQGGLLQRLRAGEPPVRRL